MITPITVGRPNFYGNNTKNNLNSKPNTTADDKNNDSNKKCLTKSENEALLKGFLLGTMIGAATVGVVTDYQTKNILNEMKMELDASHDKDLIIEDVTGDKVPEIIFEDMNGSTISYDFIKHNINIKNDIKEQDTIY